MNRQDRNITILETPSDREIVIARVFNVPRRLVFKAWTTPEHVKRWYGSEDMPLVDCQIDLRPGGSYRYVLRDPSGQEFAFSGIYQEVVPVEKLVYTDKFEGAPGGGALVTLLFEELNGKTRIVSTSLYESVESRDAHISSGMEEGLKLTLDHLEDLLQMID